MIIPPSWVSLFLPLPAPLGKFVACLGRFASSSRTSTGFRLVDGGKGSHRKFEHDKLTSSVVLSGKPGADAKHYQEKLVRARIQEANQA